MTATLTAPVTDAQRGLRTVLRLDAVASGALGVAAAGFPDLAGRAPDHVASSPGVSVRFGFPRPWRRPRPVARLLAGISR